MHAERVYRWRRTDGPGLEVLWLTVGAGRITGRSVVVDAGERPFSAHCRWDLDGEWRTRSVHIRVEAAAVRELLIERVAEATWRLDGAERPDLDGCEEVDLSSTPFCNTLALRRLGAPPGGTGELTALFVELPQLDIAPSRQRYEPLGPKAFRYVDLGANAGFTARLEVDADGFVERYEGLFERCAPSIQSPRSSQSTHSTSNRSM